MEEESLENKMLKLKQDKKKRKQIKKMLPNDWELGKESNLSGTSKLRGESVVHDTKESSKTDMKNEIVESPSKKERMNQKKKIHYILKHLYQLMNQRNTRRKVYTNHFRCTI
jgi:hypothetical protein